MYIRIYLNFGQNNIYLQYEKFLTKVKKGEVRPEKGRKGAWMETTYEEAFSGTTPFQIDGWRSKGGGKPMVNSVQVERRSVKRCWQEMDARSSGPGKIGKPSSEPRQAEKKDGNISKILHTHLSSPRYFHHVKDIKFV